MRQTYIIDMHLMRQFKVMIQWRVKVFTDVLALETNIIMGTDKVMSSCYVAILNCSGTNISRGSRKLLCAGNVCKRRNSCTMYCHRLG